MPAAEKTTRSPVESIPEPEVIRGRLAELAAEARDLRTLLRVAERQAAERGRRRQEVPHAS